MLQTTLLANDSTEGQNKTKPDVGRIIQRYIVHVLLTQTTNPHCLQFTTIYQQYKRNVLDFTFSVARYGEINHSLIWDSYMICQI